MDNCCSDVNSIVAAKTIEEAKSMDSLTEAVILACEEFGADLVRMAAREQLEGYRRSLSRVGLGMHQYSHNQIFDISTLAFNRMTDKEKHIELCRDQNVEPWLFK